tara:strand:- start:421 stop:642 length:222 start_codon:yes stop_codon:yes gene_type:complete
MGFVVGKSNGNTHYLKNYSYFQGLLGTLQYQRKCLRGNYTENTFNQDYVYSREGGSQPCIASLPQCDGLNLQR